VPKGLLSAADLRERRGDRSDGDCTDEVCLLVACGITLTKARDFVGVPHALWETWVRRDVERIVDKLKLLANAIWSLWPISSSTSRTTPRKRTPSSPPCALRFASAL
jgi:hypothetical protein